jgi:hypothetical protein
MVLEYNQRHAFDMRCWREFFITILGFGKHFRQLCNGLIRFNCFFFCVVGHNHPYPIHDVCTCPGSLQGRFDQAFHVCGRPQIRLIYPEIRAVRLLIALAQTNSSMTIAAQDLSIFLQCRIAKYRSYSFHSFNGVRCNHRRWSQNGRVS